MRSFFLLLVLANAGYVAWQIYKQPPAAEHAFGPLTLDDHTPPLMLLGELPKPPPAPVTQPPREPALQELPPPDVIAEPPT